MGLLDAIGRTDAVSRLGENILQGAKGLVSASTEVENAARANEIRQRQLALQEEAASREAEKWSIERQRAMREDEWLPESDIVSQAASRHLLNKSRRILDLAKQSGEAQMRRNPDGTVETFYRRGTLKEIALKLRDDLEGQKLFAFDEYQDARDALASAEEALRKAAARQDPAETAKAQAARDAAMEQFRAAKDAYLLLSGKENELTPYQLLSLQAKTHKGFDVVEGKTVPVFEDKLGNVYYQRGPGEFVQYTPTEQFRPMTQSGPPPSLDANWLANWRKAHPNATPEEENRAIENYRRQLVELRGESFAKARPVSVIDTAMGNVPVVLPLDTVVRENQRTPGRYLEATKATKALGQQSLLEDIRGVIDNARRSLGGLKSELNAVQRAQIAYVMKSRDPASAVSSFLGSTIAGTLTPDQVDYVTDLFQVIENLAALRSMLSAGPGSDELRRAIWQTAPGALSPNKDYARTQLDKLEAQVNRLGRGVLNVPLPPLRKTAGESLPSFATVAEAAEAARSGKIKPGDRIIVGGKPGTWR